jgi:hypothetical protein
MYRLQSELCWAASPRASDEKVRYGMTALAGASVMMTALGLHINPLAEIAGDAGPK